MGTEGRTRRAIAVIIEGICLFRFDSGTVGEICRDAKIRVTKPIATQSKLQMENTEG